MTAGIKRDAGRGDRQACDARRRPTAPWMPAILVGFWAGASPAGCSGDDSGRDAADTFEAEDSAPHDDGGRDDAAEAEDVAPPAPNLLAVSPGAGPTAGGTMVTLSGENFVRGAAATFDGTECTEAFVSTSMRMICRTPPHAEGAVAVTITNPDEQLSTLNNGFTYSDTVGPPVGWCNLQHPPTAAADVDAASEPVFGRVYVEDVTPGDGAGADISGQFGFGSRGSAVDRWTWVEAAYNASVDGATPGDLANDEYTASVPGQPAGVYSYAYRFSTDGGLTWEYCDLDGSDDGFSADQTGTLTVEPPAGPLVGWCNLQHPPALSGSEGASSEQIFGRVWVEGVTPGAGRGAGVGGQVGFGPAGAATDDWTWVDATYNIDVDGLTPGDLANDEYMQSITLPAAGAYSYAYRFTLDDGATWRLCDLGGSDDGFSTDQTGSLTVP